MNGKRVYELEDTSTNKNLASYYRERMGRRSEKIRKKAKKKAEKDGKKEKK